MVKRFINKYKGKETDPNYTLTLALINKLEPLGLVKQSDKYPFLNNELAKLYLALKAADDALNGDLTKLKDLIASGDNCALLQAFWTINRSEVGESRLKSLLFPDRQKALKVIAQGTLTTSTIDDFYCGYGNGGEETVLKLLLSTPTDDQKAVLDYIYSTAISGSTDTPLKVFIKNIDNGNFSDLMFILSDWVDKSYGGSTESWDKIVQRTDRAKREYIELGDIRLGLGVGVQSEGGKTYFNFSATFQRGTIWERKNIDAESYVVVKFTEDVSVGNFNFKKGEIKRIPATLCYWIMNSMANQAGIKLGKYAMYATFGALAVGEVLAAETGIELTIAILDLGVVTADFGMNEVLANKLNQTTEGRQFLDNFNKFVLIYVGVRVYTELTGLASEIRKTGKAIASPNDVLTEAQITEVNTTIKNAEIKAGIIPEVVVFDINKVAPLLKTNPNEAFFWSGRTNGIGGKEKALEIAQSKGGVTLEGLLDSKGVQMPLWSPDDVNAIQAWDDASAKYAEQVSGEIRAIIGQQLRQGNVWENIELPRLKSNINVTKITKVDPQTLQETIIFQR